MFRRDNGYPPQEHRLFDFVSAFGSFIHIYVAPDMLGTVVGPGNLVALLGKQSHYSHGAYILEK